MKKYFSNILPFHKNHTKERQWSPALYLVFSHSLSKCIQLEFLVGSPSLKIIITVHWQSSTQAFWESCAALKSSILGRISPTSTHSESAAEAAVMSRWHQSKHCRAQHEQDTLLIFLLHAARQSSSIRLGAVSCLRTATPSPLFRVLLDVLLWKRKFLEKKKKSKLCSIMEFRIRCLRSSRS